MSENNDLQAEPPPNPAARTPWRGWMVFALFAGVLLPLAAVTVELLLHLCSSIFFDPTPTVAHIALLACIPIANLAALMICLRSNFTLAKPVTFLLGTSIGTTVVYSLIFLPVAPFSVMGIVAFGLGLCGLSPFLALAASIVCGRRLKALSHANEKAHRGTLWAGILVAVVILGAHIVSTAVTNVGMGMAQSSDEATAARGVRMIRRFGSEAVLLRACYDLPVNYWAYDALEWRGWDTSRREQARTTYYRVAGRQFNSMPPPRLIGFRSEMTSDFQFDPDVGGTAVNSRVTDLSLESSRIDAVVDPDALTAYTEWTMTFRNNSSVQREARAEIALPPGGVVSRLTLWVHGEEREAAFAGRGKVREAYQQVAVVQSRDPVLVTTCGPDRVLMQCFPVSEGGGTMKVRVGITSPLVPEDLSKAHYVLPRFAERNFGVPDGVKHAVLIESPLDMSAGGQRGRAIQLALADGQLAGSIIECERDADVRRVWTPDRQDNGHAIVQELAQVKANPPGSVVIVMDGSLPSKSAKEQVAEALDALPKNSRFAVIGAGDEAEQLTQVQSVSTESVKAAQGALRGFKSVGGIDNRPALLKALYMAAGEKNSTIVWVCGAQPFASGAYTEQILQWIERHPGAITIHSLATAGGRNNVTADLDRTGAISAVPRLGTVSQDLRMLFSRWSDGSMEMVRMRVPIGEVAGAARGSSHIARLWARDEVMRVCRAGDTRLHPDAARFAADYQIVTPVSGAVVLENEQQYKEAKLKPVDPKSTPSVVPEPAGWIALGFGFAGMATLVLRRRRSVWSAEAEV